MYGFGVVSMNRFEEFFGKCSFCHKEKFIVFWVEWKGQQSTPSNRWIKGGKYWLCSLCCKDYGQLPNNYEYDLEINGILNNNGK